MAPRTPLASFDTPIAEAAVQELIGIWIVTRPEVNLRTLVQSINSLITFAARTGIGYKTLWASAIQAQRIKDFDVSNREVICDVKLGAPSMGDLAFVVSLFDQDAIRKSDEFNHEYPPLIKIKRHVKLLST